MFPIVVGTGPHHSSSRPFPNIISRDHTNDEEDGARSGDGSEVRQQQQQQNVIMAMGTNEDETMNATMFIGYHFLPIDHSHGDMFNDRKSDDNVERMALLHGEATAPQQNRSSPLDLQDDGTQFNVVAELRVQITHVTSPFSSNIDAMSNRETKSRVPLGMMRKQHTSFIPNPSIEFSANKKYLACLIPLPSGYELVPSSEFHMNHPPMSTIVIFRIQAKTLTSQQQQRKLNLPKLPDYILENSTDEDRESGELDITASEAVEDSDVIGESFQHMSSAPTVPISSSRVHATSYVAHGPKLVRAPRPQNQQNVDDSVSINNDLTNRLFRRNLSSESGLPGPLHSATCMCTVPSDHHRGESSSAGSFLLVGTVDGKFLKVDFSTATVRSVQLDTIPGDVKEDHDDGGRILSTKLNSVNGKNRIFSDNDQHSKCGINPIVHLSQCTPTHWKPLDIYGEEQGSISKGRVAAVLRDGSVNIYTTSFTLMSVPRDGLLREKNIMKEVESSKNHHRLNGNRYDGTKHIGLDVQFYLMASFRPPLSCLDASSTHLRYIRAKWIKPCALALSTRSPLLDDDDAVIGWSDDTSASQTEMVVAHVWSVAEVTRLDQVSQHESQWEIPSNCDAAITLISELKLPLGDSLNEFIQDTFSLSECSLISDFGSNLMGRQKFSECTRGQSILYHRLIDCLAIVAQEVTCTVDSNGITLIIRPICVIWDWKRNVPGLTLACSNSYKFFVQQDNADIRTVPSIFSWFQLGDDDKYGLCAVHVYEQTLRKDMRRACKHIFCLSTLSPRNMRDTEGCLSVNEPSALLLHRDSIMYPRICKPTNSMDISLEWAESRVPPTYVGSNGPCQIAAVGKDFGRSIAVAASRGLCVLDLSRVQQLESGRFGSTNQSPRWKLFSNVNDEHRFRVLGMIWWETANQDFLLAVVKFKLDDTLRLACWSSRAGIGFGERQLLKGSVNGDFKGDEEAYNYGVALPPGFFVHSMSLIKDPADKLPGRATETSNRALLLLAQNISHNEPASCSIKYALCQLQVVLPKVKQERVLARIIAHGKIPMELGCPNVPGAEVVTGIFLAGGSFLFNLDMGVDDSDSQDYIAMIGILTMYHGLLAVCIRQEGNNFNRPSLLPRARGVNHQLLVAYWEAGSISSSHGTRIAWNVAQNDGEVFCWSVPCRNAASFDLPHEGNGELPSETLLGIEQHPIYGDFSHLGLSSLWRNGAATSEREVALGPFLPKSFGSTLYAGQKSRMKIVPSGPGAMSSLHVSNCTVAPPQFTPVLFVSFLILSLESSCDCDSGWQLINRPNQGSSKQLGAESDRHLARETIHSTLRQVRGLGSSASALRIITLKVIEILDESKVSTKRVRGREILDGTASDRVPNWQKWEVGKAMLIEIVSAASMIYDELGFATFFLSIGRQLEPHQFNLIFPLPKESPATTAEDLFILSCEHGSLFTALSALPLFSCYKGSQKSVTKLVYHCLIKIDESFRSCLSSSSTTSVQDESFLHQLFWFGVKLEDAIELGNLNTGEGHGLDYAPQSGENEIFDSNQFSIVSSSTESAMSNGTDEFGSVASDPLSYTTDTCSSDESSDESSEGTSPRQKSSTGFFERVTKRVLVASGSSINNRSQEEDAIHEAASSFILSGLGDTSVLSHNKDTLIYNSTPFHSVAGAVCLFIDYEIVSARRGDESDRLSYGWKAVSLVAHLLQGERETSAITSAGTKNAKALTRMMTIKDFINAYPPQGNVHVKDDKCHSFVAGLLERITWRCRQQLQSQALNSVFNLVLLLFLRNDTCGDVNLCRPTLAVVGIVAGHLCGRIGELLDFAVTSTINSIYSLYTTRLNS